MQVLLIFITSLLALGSAFNLSYVLPDVDSWFVSAFYNNGTATWLKRSVVESELKAIKNVKNVVKYYLYTEDNPTAGQQIIKGDSSSLHRSNFNTSNPTRILVHGFKASHHSEVCTVVRDAYLKKEPNNFICIDWSEIACRSLVTARVLLPSVGHDLGEFINFLGKAGGMSNKNLIVVSHSYGTHVSGFAGKYLKKVNNPLPIIVACDPAHALISYADCSSRICHTDADFVESIQTTAGSVGFSKPIGGGAYYPNGGSNQPGCSSDKNKLLCDHLISYRYFAEAVVHDDFPTIKCKNYKNALAGKCGTNYSSVMMGSVQSFGKKGIFYVPVNSKKPYGKGS